MNMAKGIQDMSVETIKGKEGSEPEAIKRVKSPKKPKMHNRVGKGNFSPTIIMKDASGRLFRVKRNDVLARIESGFVPMSKTKYREALASGASDVVSATPVVRKKK
jgi:hypothetical protein